MIVYIKKMTKTDEKKGSFKNWYVDHVLLYHFLNDENHTQIVCPGKKKLIWPHVLKHKWMEAAFAVLIFEYTRRRKLELTFSNFLTIQKIELYFTNLFNHGKNNQHGIVYWSLGRRKVLTGCQLCNLEIRLRKSEEQKDIYFIIDLILYRFHWVLKKNLSFKK